MSNISFFIPAYNCAETIEEAMVSIIETNLEEGDELIIVNDCSTDSTGNVLIELKKNYPQIVLLDHKRNKGGAATRNTAVENAKHELLFCLDSDNVLEPLSIAPLKKYLTDNKADVASFQHQHFFINDKDIPAYIWSLPEGEFSVKNILYGENNPGQHGNYLFTKQSWIRAKGYAEGTGALDTWTFGLRQAITGAKMMVLKDTFYYHRLNHEHSYWMKDAEAKLWLVSLKASYALFPFYELIAEDFLNYMLGKGKYTWFYTLNKKPLKLVERGAKEKFYLLMHNKIHDLVYPEKGFFQKAFNKMIRILKGTK